MGSTSVLQSPFGDREPDPGWNGAPQQIVDVPMGDRGRFEMVTNARTKSSCAKGAANISVKPRDNLVRTQSPNFDARHLPNCGDEHVRTFSLRQICLHREKRLQFSDLMGSVTTFSCLVMAMGPKLDLRL